MSKIIEIKVPIYVDTGKIKKKSRSINLNSYRNWQFTLSNNIKKKFKEIIKKDFPVVKKPISMYRLEYYLYLPNKRKADVSNICSIVDKFTNDALVEEGIVEEDNYQHLQDIRFMYDGYCENKEGYVIVKVIEVDELKPI